MVICSQNVHGTYRVSSGGGGGGGGGGIPMIFINKIVLMKSIED